MGPGTADTDTRATTETLGVAVLIGMTIVVTAGLGLGVLAMAEDEAEQTAEVDFNFLSETLVIVYQDSTDREAGSLYVDGPDNNVSWAALDGSEPETLVSDGDAVEVGPDTEYGAQIDDEDPFDLVYITEAGERIVLASVHEEDELDDSPLGPDSDQEPDF